MFEFYSEYLVFLWLGLVILFLVLEAMTCELITIWFAVGAFVTTIVAVFMHTFWIQLAVFMAVSIILLYFTRPSVLRKLKKNNEKLNIDAAIGQTAIVVKQINPNVKGEVKHKHLIWMATTRNKSTIEIDKEVKILAVEGATFIVEEIN